jgi:hypothetical protein
VLAIFAMESVQLNGAHFFLEQHHRNLMLYIVALILSVR